MQVSLRAARALTGLRAAGVSPTASSRGVASARALFASAPTASDDTHDDFKPKLTAEADLLTVEEEIAADVKSNPVFLYMKGTPARPQCGFSNMACRILDAHGIAYGSRDVLSDPELREGIKAFTHWPTIPQVFIRGEFVGGSDILLQMHQSGELEKELEGVEKL